MEINVNQQCEIVLLERGVEAINAHYKNLQLTPPVEYKVGDKYKGALWDVMNIFGEYSYMWPQPPFQTTFELFDL